jgi:hypothetical protein
MFLVTFFKNMLYLWLNKRWFEVGIRKFILAIGFVFFV